MKRYLYIALPVCLSDLLLVVRPWSSRRPASLPVASTEKQDKQLLVGDASGQLADHLRIHHARRSAETGDSRGSELKVGDDLNSVLDRLGALKDNVNYGEGSFEPQHGRARLLFPKRVLSGANDFDPLVYIVFDEKRAKLFASPQT
jgi:hypothetical protein